MTVAAVITKLAAIEAALSGVKAHDKTPEQISVFPSFINYPAKGTLTSGPPTLMKGIHTVRAEVHVSRQSLPDDESLARPYVDSFPKAIWADPTLGGTVSTVLEVRYEYGQLQFGKDVHIGVRFEIDFKLQEGTT